MIADLDHLSACPPFYHLCCYNTPMIFTIDLKPLSVNDAWQGRRFKSKAYKDFEKSLLWLLPRNIKPIEGRVEIRYKFHMKNHSQADWDNPIKPLQDVLVTSGILKNDQSVYLGIGQKMASNRDYFEVMILPYVERDIFA